MQDIENPLKHLKHELSEAPKVEMEEHKHKWHGHKLHDTKCTGKMIKKITKDSEIPDLKKIVDNLKNKK